ncbi:MAG TPA: VOC family protein [Candidatus Dormibacteraeota bacterium]|nr:VOC family protein [Candidatus Dormibacteraeota bacterium]
MLSTQAIFAMYVPDVRAALDFYTDKLGFRVITDHADDEFSYATAAPEGATWRLIFSRPDIHGPELAERFEAEVGFSPHFLLAAEDLGAEIKRLERAGVEIVDHPTLQATGMIQAHVKDLYGNVITLIAESDLF